MSKNEVVELTPFMKARQNYIQTMRLGSKGKATLQELDQAWFDWNVLREDEFGAKLKDLGSLEKWKESFRRQT